MFIDARARVIMGWALSLRPSTAEVLAALRDAMTIQPDGLAVGGVPERLRIDHGLEFCAEAVRAAALALNVEFSLATEYTPEEKGKIERLHLTCVQTFLSGLPQYTDGRRDRKRRLEDPRAPLGLEQSVSLFADWVTDYNHVLIPSWVATAPSTRSCLTRHRCGRCQSQTRERCSRLGRRPGSTGGA
jgi:putative transposase